MKEKQLLFVTYHYEDFAGGLSYAVDLAKTMGNSIGILIIYKRRMTGEREDNRMAASTSAAPGGDSTAMQLIRQDCRQRGEDFEKKLSLIRDTCRKAGVSVDVRAASTEVISAIKDALGQNAGIDMVLLGPGITNDGSINSKTLNRLVKTASRPIVTMAKQAGSA
ncbi:MAG: hypothetical protein P8Z71_06210 [Candidatus Sulfobium sp.]|jgi:hypothetical protein